MFPFRANLDLPLRVDTERLQQENRSLRADTERLQQENRSLRADTERLQQENRSVNNIPYGLLSYLEPILLQIPGRDL